jgi:hypothetical protein
VEGQRAEAAAGHLLLELAARADEDCRRARFVDRHARARDLSSRSTPQADQLPGALDHRDDNPVSVLERVSLGGIEHCLDTVLVDDPVGV